MKEATRSAQNRLAEGLAVFLLCRSLDLPDEIKTEAALSDTSADSRALATSGLSTRLEAFTTEVIANVRDALLHQVAVDCPLVLADNTPSEVFEELALHVLRIFHCRRFTNLYKWFRNSLLRTLLRVFFPR